MITDSSDREGAASMPRATRSLALLTVPLLGIALAVVAHGAIPRYEWRTVSDDAAVLIRIDRWTGVAQWGMVQRRDGRWLPIGAPGFENPRAAHATAPAPSSTKPAEPIDPDDLERQIDEALAQDAAQQRGKRSK